MTGASSLDPLELRNTLFFMLEAAARRAGPRFSGLGVIVSDAPHDLPLFPIGPPLQLDLARGTEELLGELAVDGGAHHDGFHILTSTLKLAAVSQYFSPPVVTGLPIDRSKQFGGRYLAAMFGSVLPETLVTGIATPALGAMIFRNGREC